MSTVPQPEEKEKNAAVADVLMRQSRLVEENNQRRLKQDEPLEGDYDVSDSPDSEYTASSEYSAPSSDDPLSREDLSDDRKMRHLVPGSRS